MKGKALAAKIAAQVQLTIAMRQRVALEHIQRIQEGPEGDTPWEDRTVRDAVNLKLVEMAAASARAASKAPVTNVAFGVVVVPQRIEDPAAWEAQARQVGATPARPAIEAEVVPDEPGRDET